jgi:hypothetical protein
MDALHQAFFFWLKPYIGTDVHVPGFPDLATVPHRLFPYYARQARLLRNLMNTPAWDRLRAADWKTKLEGWLQAIKEARHELSAEETKRAAIAIHAFSTPNMWRWLVDITGCSQSEAEDIAAWATGALMSAVEHEASGDSGTPRKTGSRKKGIEK